MLPDYLPLVISWLCFGLVHSFTAMTAVKQRVMSNRKWVFNYYRLLYNGLSVLTFLPVLLAYRATPKEPVSTWQGASVPGLLLIGLGVVVGLVALSGYNLAEFSGIPPRQPVAETEGLRQQGLLRYVRHPLYLAMLICLLGMFVRQPSWANLLFGGLAYLYLRIGIHYEEMKLIATFGDDYRQYQARVPMLLPFSGRKQFG